MPDATRDNLLREAAALARQGKLDQAVKQYEAALELTPDDWATANLIGDLWMKLGDSAAAKRYFDTAANRLADEGFHAKASALFKKILKIWPDDDNARVRAAEIAERQELYADSDAHYRAAIAARRARGDVEGAQALEERIRVRAAVEEEAAAAAAGEAPAAAETQAAAPAGPSAGERWATSVALSPDRITELVTGLELPAAPAATPPPAVPYTTAAWGSEGSDGVVAALDAAGVDPQMPGFDVAEALGSIGAIGDGWRELVRQAIRPEWVAGIEARRRAAEEQAATAAASIAVDPEPALEPAGSLVIVAGELPLAEESVAVFAIEVDEPPSSVEPAATVESAPAIEPNPLPSPSPVLGMPDRPDVADIHAVFEYLRAAFGAAHTMQARDWLTRGHAWLASGDLASGIPALERATSASTVRGEAATALGRHYLHRGNPTDAVFWLERAAECPADDEQVGQALVYDIGCALQELGEDLRALAVFSELRRAAGGSWGDVNERIDRLSGLA